MIQLLAHPFAPLSRQPLVSLSQSSCVSPIELTDGSGTGKGVDEEPNHATARKPGPQQIIQYSRGGILGCVAMCVSGASFLCVHNSSDKW
jgi:hypothetical protein